MSEESKNRTMIVTIIATTGIVAALTMSIIAVVQTGNGTHMTGNTMPMHRSAVAAQPAKAQTASIVIQHVMRGCHAMVVNGQMPMTPNATLRLTPGSTLKIVDNDVMPHKLVQVGGPAAALSGASMAHMGATSTVTFPKAGTYSLTTRAGEDYTQGIKTVGEDNTLKIRVTVAA